MDSLSYLKPLMEKQKTLVITCEECGLDAHDHEQVFTFVSLGNILQRSDSLQQECIRYYIEDKKCSRIIIAGHEHCKVIAHILSCSLKDSPLAAMKLNLQALLRDNHAGILRTKIQESMLVELNVIQQSTMLLEYDFIRERIKNGTLDVVGLVAYAHTKESKQVFYNGITFNDLISLN